MADDTQNSQQTPQDQTQAIEDIKKDVDQTLDAAKNQIHQDPAIGQNFASSPPLQDTVVDIEKDLIDEIFKRIDQEFHSPRKRGKERLKWHRENPSPRSSEDQLRNLKRALWN